MTRNTEIARAVRYAILVGAATVAAASSLPAQAQVQAQTTDTTTLTTVVVTGSRIPHPNLEEVSPVTAISSDEVKLTGATRVEDLLNNLPQVMAAEGGNLANGASGAAQVNLRGLGSQRTLVLVNSRRLMPGDPSINGQESPDLNQIPASLIQRIDVLTGGASAVYGADAVAGVVNFIMNDHFQGVRIDANASLYQHEQKEEGWIAPLYAANNFALPSHTVSPGTGKDITVVIGNNFADDAGNVTVYAGYRNLAAILQNKYDYSACSLNGGDTFTCGGSSTSPTGRFEFFGAPNPPFPPSDNNIGPGGALVPFSSANNFNYGALNYYQRPDERYTAGMFAHLKVNEHVEAYSEFMFMDDHTRSQVAPSGAFGQGFGINCNNPLLSASEVQTWCTNAGLGPTDTTTVYILRRNVEGGNRINDLSHTSYRTVLGLRGEIAPGWKYDAYILDGTSRLAENFLNDVSRTRIQFALNAIAGPGGTAVCSDAGAVAAGCVPWNVFSLRSVTPAAAAYIGAPGFSAGFTTERIFNATVTGDLGSVKTPWAKDGLGIAVGAEYRQEKSAINFDSEFLAGDLLGQGGASTDTSGQFHVWEGITEARMPLIQDAPFAKSLDLELGYRYSSYTEGFTTNTYKIGVQWSPIDDFHFRGSLQQAVRAPNIQELFRPNAVVLDGSADPCSGTNPTGSVAGCVAAGVPASAYGTVIANPAGQYNGLEGGNTQLLPEKSKTKSFGIVFTPAFMNGFTASIDYYDIDITGTIGVYGADFILGQCVATQSPQWCADVHRNAGNNYSLWLGTSGFISDTNFNTGALATKGIDLTADYRLNMGRAGKLSFDLLTTYVKSIDTTPVTGGGTYNCVGYYGQICGIPSPRWRGKLRTTWGTPVDGLDVSLDWRHVGQAALDLTSQNILLNGGAPASDAPKTDLKLGTRDYFDLVGVFTHQKISYRLGINNLLDKDPPLFGSEVAGGADSVLASGNTFPNVYDALGRFIFVNITADF